MPTKRSADVVIIGTGAMGAYLAARAAGQGLKVTCIEVDDIQVAQVRSAVSAPPTHRGVHAGWTLGLGGTTQWWGGQLWPWQPHEFSEPAPGGRPWPQELAAAVGSRYGDVLRRLGLSEAHDEIHGGALVDRQLNGGLRTGTLRHSSWMGRRERQFVLNETLTRGRAGAQLVRGVARRVEPSTAGWRVEVETPTGPRWIDGRRVVLAAGTFNNVSVLARSSVSAGLPHLGRGFMDHVSYPVAEFHIRDLAAARRLIAPQLHRGVLASPRLVPSGQRHGYGHWEITQPDWLDSSSAKTALRDRDVRSAAAVAAGAGPKFGLLGGALASGLVGRHRPVVAGSRVRLRVDVEQAPSEHNRLHYDVQADAVRVAWAAQRQDESIARMVGGQVLADLDLAAIGLELVEILEPVGEDIFHLMGGTPLGLGGVLDDGARVPVDNGFMIAGASAFVSGGMANPTMTALALADVCFDRYLGG